LSHLVVSDRLAVGGLLRQTDGPLTLTVTHLGSTTDGIAPTIDTPAEEPWSDWDGALVSLGPLEVTGSGATGRAETTSGIELVDVLLNDSALPEVGTWTIRGPLRVDDRTDPPTVQLLPRSADDWTAVD
jgi:hypothetical protein